MKIKYLYAGVASGALAVCLLSAPAAAQGVSLNSENLSSFEEPIATSIGNITVGLTGLADARVTADLDDGDFDPGLVANFQLDLSTQLPNRWNVGLSYFGQFDSNPGGILDFGGGGSNGEYTDNIAAFIGGAWGTLLAGEVSGVVREETRRGRGAGNSALAFDETYGKLSDWSAGYVGQFGPARISGAVDEDGDFDLGFSWSRPLGTKDWRFTARYTNADYLAEDGITLFDTHALTGTARFIYGASTYSVGLGYEMLDGVSVDVDRWYATAGWRTKTGPWTFSLEGHYGQVGGEPEISAAAGAQYDLARGLSLNFGLNYADADLVVQNIPVVQKAETQAILSLRYSF